MIDLRNKELPSRLEWDGNSASIDTSFRTWIEFDRLLSEDKMIWTGIFTDGIPENEGWIQAAIDFWKCDNLTPRPTRQPRNIKLIDYIEDGDHIVASFQSAYGIDLTTEDMHWHRFKALLGGLPDNAKMSKIIGYRDYDPSDAKRKYEDIQREQKLAWSLPLPEDEDDEMGGFGDLINAFG